MSRKDAELYTATKELIATPSQSVQNKAELSRLLNIPRTTMLLMFQASIEGLTQWRLTPSGRKKSFTNRERNNFKRLVKSNRRLILKNIVKGLNPGVISKG